MFGRQDLGREAGGDALENLGGGGVQTPPPPPYGYVKAVTFVVLLELRSGPRERLGARS